MQHNPACLSRHSLELSGFYFSASRLHGLVLQVMREDGVRGFYRGCTTNLVRTTPAAALTFTSYELIARTLRAKNEEQ